MARIGLHQFRIKLLGFAFKVLLVSMLLSSLITWVMCAGYVDGELLLRLEATQAMASEMLEKTGLAPEEVARLLSSADYLVHEVDPQGLTDGQRADIADGENVTTGFFMSKRVFFLLGGAVMAVESYPANTLLLSALLRSLLGNLIVVALGFVVVYLLSRRMAQPIVGLTAAARQLAKGNFDITVDAPMPRFAGGIREIAELTDTFNRMASELKCVEYLRRDFTSNLSHELKSPVASIRGYARLLLCEGLSEQQIREYAQAIAAESERLSSLADNLLKLTRLEGQIPTLLHEKYYLDEQLRRCVSALHPDIERKGLSIAVDLPKTAIAADEELLLQVWRNLLTNAIKFTPPGGHIRVALSRSRGVVTVLVEDDGPGMDETACARVFEKFYQADASRNMGGNGLGLSLVKRIVDICAGDIRVKSEVGRGSQFIVTLPAAPAPREK